MRVGWVARPGAGAGAARERRRWRRRRRKRRRRRRQRRQRRRRQRRRWQRRRRQRQRRRRRRQWRRRQRRRRGDDHGGGGDDNGGGGDGDSDSGRLAYVSDLQFPNLLMSPPWSNPANRLGPQTMSKCRSYFFLRASLLLSESWGEWSPCPGLHLYTARILMNNIYVTIYMAGRKELRLRQTCWDTSSAGGGFRSPLLITRTTLRGTQCTALAASSVSTRA